jgi:hypothetical protein
MYLEITAGGFTKAAVADIIGWSRGTSTGAGRGEIGELR